MPLPKSFNIDAQRWLDYFKPFKAGPASLSPEEWTALQHQQQERIALEKEKFAKIIQAHPTAKHLKPGGYKIDGEMIELPFHIHKINNNYYLATEDKKIIGQFISVKKNGKKYYNDLIKVKDSKEIGVQDAAKKNFVLRPGEDKLLYSMLQKNPDIEKFTGGFSWYQIGGGAKNPQFISLPSHFSLIRAPNKEIWITMGSAGEGVYGKALVKVGKIKLDPENKVATPKIYPKKKWGVVKKINYDSNDPQEFGREVKREVQNIKEVYDYKGPNEFSFTGRYGYKVAIPMPLFQGVPGDKLKINSPEQQFTFFLELMHALKDFHEKGKVHLDLKPANLIYDEATETLKLIDLGSTVKEGERTGIAGTPYFMAPEVWKEVETNEMVATSKNDTFAAAAIVGTVFDGNHINILKPRIEHAEALAKQGLMADAEGLKGFKEIAYNFENIGNTPGLSDLLKNMAALDPNQRPSDEAIIKAASEMFAKVNPDAYKTYLLKRELSALAEEIAKEIPTHKKIKEAASQEKLPFYKKLSKPEQLQIKNPQKVLLAARYQEVMGMVTDLVKNKNTGSDYIESYRKAIVLIDNYLAQEKQQGAEAHPQRQQRLQGLRDRLVSAVPEAQPQAQSQAASSVSEAPAVQQPSEGKRKHRHHRSSEHGKHRHKHKHLTETESQIVHLWKGHRQRKHTKDVIDLSAPSADANKHQTSEHQKRRALPDRQGRP